jgi:hypothetical protein
MGYLTDNLSVRGVGDCPALYPWELTVHWELNDPFTAPRAIDQLSRAIQLAIPDVEEWQLSVYRRPQTRAKYRFRTEAGRDLGVNALSNPLFALGPVFVKRLGVTNPPDRVTRGIE